jgi:hypothetical protein
LTAGQTDGKTDTAKIFVALGEWYSDEKIVDPRQCISLRFVNRSINLNKVEKEINCG